MEKELKLYNKKRNFNKTSEPKGEKSKSKKKLRFVVQHHAARKDHYDLRLEMKGVMKSWAIPKGPSCNTKDKRLAVEVEDHPLSYRNFEGTIPKGEYGGGTVMVWDRGYYEIKAKNSMNSSKFIKFVLKGERLKGAWTLINIKDSNWLLIKEKDKFSGYSNILKYDTSIKTGRTMNEIATNSPKKNIIKITNPEKTIYKKDKVKKIDIYNYYKKVSNRMLPYLEGRVLSTLRCPLGVEGEKFFKKHLGENKYLKEIKVKNKKGENEDFYYIKDILGLLSEVQMNSIEFHTSASNVNNIKHPNILVFDLDPDEKLSLSKLREGVRDLKDILDHLNLKSYLKTSGGKGYHVVVPLKESVTWKKLRNIAQSVAKVMEEKWPEKYTSSMSKTLRKNRIFIDWLRNTEGASCVAAYSLRARKKNSVSMPIKWSELDKIKPDDIDIKEALKRLRRKDPWEDFFTNL